MSEIEGKKEITYLHPKLEPILNETYGIIVYQEQVMRITSDLGGFSLAESDIMRRIMGKKKKEEMDKKAIENKEKNKEENRKNKVLNNIDKTHAYFEDFGA